jgi:transporter family-2 protein
MQLISYLVAFVAGLMLTVQVGLNATLDRAVGNICFEVLSNFSVGLIGILIYVVASREHWPTRQGLATVPMWAGCGGWLGAFYAAVATRVGARIGAAALLALTVFGQLMAAAGRSVRLARLSAAAAFSHEDCRCGVAPRRRRADRALSPPRFL